MTDRELRSTTTRLETERGTLFVTVCTDAEGLPIRVLGSLGKAGSMESGMAQTACRLVTMLLERGAPAEEEVRECRGTSEMQPWPNRLPGGRSAQVRGIADGIALALAEAARAADGGAAAA